MTPPKVDAGFRTSRQTILTSLGQEKCEAVFRPDARASKRSSRKKSRN